MVCFQVTIRQTIISGGPRRKKRKIKRKSRISLCSQPSPCKRATSRASVCSDTCKLNLIPLHVPSATYIYIHIHTYTYIYIHMHTYAYIYMHVHTCTYIYIHIHIRIRIHTYTYASVQYRYAHPRGITKGFLPPEWKSPWLGNESIRPSFPAFTLQMPWAYTGVNQLPRQML